MRRAVPKGSKPTAGQDGTTLRYAACALALVSQAIHLIVLPNEFAVRPLSGFFVLLVTIWQGMLAASLLLGPARWTVRFGVLLNAGIVATWTVTRFTGFPALLGFAWLPVEPLNLTATVAEVALIVLLWRIGRELKNRRTQ